MSVAFDEVTFLAQSLSIKAACNGKLSAQLTGEVDALRRARRGVCDRPARGYLRRDLGRRLLRFAMDMAQPRAVVDRIYLRCIRRGFNDLHAEVVAALEYSAHWQERGTQGEGSPKGTRQQANGPCLLFGLLLIFSGYGFTDQELDFMINGGATWTKRGRRRSRCMANQIVRGAWASDKSECERKHVCACPRGEHANL